LAHPFRVMRFGQAVLLCATLDEAAQHAGTIGWVEELQPDGSYTLIGHTK